MAYDMRRRFAVTTLCCALAACGDDSSQSSFDGTVTDEDDFGDDDDDDDDDDGDEFSTFSDEDGPSDVDDGPFDESDSDEFGDISSGSFDTSDTFESSDSFTTNDVSTTENETTTDTATTDTTTTDTTTEPTSDTDTTTTTDDTTTDTDGTTTDTESESESETGGGFDPPPPFGDDVQELDLVGMWNLNWDPASGWDSLLEVDDAGNFFWTESSADCSTSTVASGFLWVEGVQVVMHVEEWERPLPWDTEPAVGQTFPPPFRLRMSFSLQGSGGDAYMTLGAPSRITETAPYTGESYVRTLVEGIYLGGDWNGEAELLAIPEGEMDPVVIVRDYYLADLSPEADMLDPQGVGTRSITTQYFPVPSQSSVFDGGNWTCLGGCPQPSGTTLVNGGNLYTYGPYAGQTHLLTFASGRTFRRDVDSDCP
ncbi:MAG TPA: hypothetical protein VFG69_12990 [Nannocystaceae bacterium]|nr:hypothetical protein [Nannocystaceae bacterium]